MPDSTIGITVRVICAGQIKRFISEDMAFRWLTDTQHTGTCPGLHTIECLSDGVWMPRRIVRARRILSSTRGIVIDSPDGPLTVAHRVNPPLGSNSLSLAEQAAMTPTAAAPT